MNWLPHARPRKHKYRMATWVIWIVLNYRGRLARDGVKHVIRAYPVRVHLVPGMQRYANCTGGSQPLNAIYG